MVTILAKTINEKKGVLFIEPYIVNKKELRFTDNTINIRSFFNIDKEEISIELAGGIYPMKIDKEDVEILREIHKKEFEKAIVYYNSIFKKETEIWICDKSVCSKELIDNNFNPYYNELTLFGLNKLLKTNAKNLDDLLEILMKKKTVKKDMGAYGEVLIVKL